MTSSLNVLHSRRSQTLFLFLSSKTKLKVAIFSSSVAHFVLSALIVLRKIIKLLFFLNIFSPHICICSNLSLEKFLQILEKFVLLGTPGHRSRGSVRVASWLFVLHGSARNWLSCILVHTPAIACRTIALNSLIATIDSALG